MSVALVAATALLYFSSQEIVHAAAAFEAAFESTLFHSLLTGPAASAQAYLATMKTWHAAAAPAAAVKGFFHRDLLAEPAAASECEVVDLIQPAVAASAAAKGNDGCLCDLANHVFEMVLRVIWSLVGAFGLCGLVEDLVLCLPVFFVLFLEKTCRCLMVGGRIKFSNQGFDPGGFWGGQLLRRRC